MTIRNALSHKIEGYLKAFEMKNRRDDYHRWLEKQGWGLAEDFEGGIDGTIRWLMGKSEPEKPEPKPDPDDAIREPVPHIPDEPPQDEPEDDESFMLKRSWLK